MLEDNKGYSETINQRMTDTTMAKRKKKRKANNIQNTTQKSKDRAT